MNELPHILSELFGAPKPADEPVEEAPRKLKGDTAEESASLGSQSLLEGDYETAIKHFETAMKQRGTRDPQSHLDLGAAYEAAGRTPQAFRQYCVALRSSRGLSESYVGKSQILRTEGKARRAAEELVEAIRVDEENAYLRFKLAELLRSNGERRSATEAIQAAIARAPLDSFYHYWLGDLLIERREWDAAVEALHAAVELSPGDDYLLFRTAAAFWGCGKKKEAVRAIRLAGELDPDKLLYYGVLAVMLEALGEGDEASVMANRADRMDELDRENLRRFCEEVGLSGGG